MLVVPVFRRHRLRPARSMPAQHLAATARAVLSAAPVRSSNTALRPEDRGRGCVVLRRAVNESRAHESRIGLGVACRWSTS